MKTIFSLLFALNFSLIAQIPIQLTITPFTDFTYTDVEPNTGYNFDFPVSADILSVNPLTYVPAYDNRYFMSIYGPRHKQVSTSNIGFFDFHKGTDINANVDFGGMSYDENNPPDIHCVCDGEIHNIFTGPNPEMTGTGIYVEVKCDDTFNANMSWSNIYTAYRHLASVAPGLNIGDPINKGDVVGPMGESGFTTTVHLHFSVIRRNTGSAINVHPMRIFDPTSAPHLIDYLTTAEIIQLSHTNTEAHFRIAIPYNRVNIRAIEVNLAGGGYSKVYDFETISQLPEEDRDDNDILSGLEFFAYPLNRGHSAYRRVWDRYEEGQIPAVYPASPDAGVGNFVPFLSENLFQTPAYILDLKVKNLPNGFNINDLEISIIDIWGYGVQTNGQTQATDEHFAWSMIAEENDDAEEYETGTISLDSPDLDLVFDAGHGDQEIGLRFENLELPKNANITNAWLQFRADETTADVTNLTLHGEWDANAADFSTISNDISDRMPTAASANWAPNSWTIDDMNADQKWTGITNIVQELANQNAWTTSSPMVFLISGSGRREAEGYAPTNLWKNAYVYIEYDESLAMPLDLSYFQGHAKSDFNLLKWQVLAQQNLDWMILERSENGTKNWQEVGKIAGKLHSTVTRNYQIKDENPSEESYYRLKFLDRNGEFEYSNTVLILRGEVSGNLNVFPNPVRDELNIDLFSNEFESIQINVQNLMGQTVKTQMFELTKGENRLVLNFEGLVDGVYFLNLKKGQIETVFKVMKN